MRQRGGRRSDRVGNLLVEELSRIIRRELEDPRVGFVSVTGAEVTDDLRQARVYVTVLGEGDEARVRSLAALNGARPFIRGLLGRRLRLKRIPEIEFRYDPSLDRGFHIQGLLDTLGDDLRGDEGKG